jgi:hypothetical protein
VLRGSCACEPWSHRCICYLERRDLEGLLRNNPEAGLKLARMLAGRLVWMEARWAGLAAKEVPARLASMLLLLLESEGSSRLRATGYPPATLTSR